MFTGNYFNTIDAKGRVFIPTKLRFSLGERVWLVKGVDACLYILTEGAWREFTAEYITKLTLKDAKARKLQRFFLGNSREVEIDKQGRVNLPQDHIEYAAIEKDVVFVGCGERIELWGAESFGKEMDPKAFDPDELMRGAAGITDEE
ncbi:MAG: division/cell wall cluster transcriptional repressor MraZ [Clostridiales Family XIII bacterium]|jgi:MraZ protein|nr:division/cell wall cluster transcriptional repressor MraZ [Clostridiales Family XIII bacterium]